MFETVLDLLDAGEQSMIDAYVDDLISWADECGRRAWIDSIAEELLDDGERA
jgi:hypothetical protein